MGRAQTNSSDSWTIDHLFRCFGEFVQAGRIEKNNDMESYLVEFDVDGFTKELNDQLAKFSVTSCKMNMHHSPNVRRPFAVIEVADGDAHRTSSCLRYIADIYEMFVLDPTSGKSYAPDDPFDDHIIELRSRSEAINGAIRAKLPNIRYFDMLDYDHKVRSKHSHSYVLVLSRDSNASPKDSVALFVDILRDSLAAGEVLKFDGKCFTVEVDKLLPEWQIVYSLEFDTDGQCVRGYISDDGPVAEMICRPPFLSLKETVNKHDDGYEIYDRLTIDEMIARYPDPIDRLNRSLEISNEIARSNCYLTYSRRHLMSSGVVFHRVSWQYRTSSSMIKHDSSSILSIDVLSAGPILSIIDECYPYMYSIRSSYPNLIPIQAWKGIEERMREIISILNDDPSSEELSRYVEYHVGRSSDRSDDAASIKEDAEHLIKLLDIFLKWLEAQQEIAKTSDMINVEGP